MSIKLVILVFNMHVCKEVQVVAASGPTIWTSTYGLEPASYFFLN